MTTPHDLAAIAALREVVRNAGATALEPRVQKRICTTACKIKIDPVLPHRRGVIGSKRLILFGGALGAGVKTAPIGGKCRCQSTRHPLVARRR